ncbi:alpha/beta hydrolase [Rhodanobacter sp. Col0626]|uniref:alpha/beta hydrolase n=1 Tax=Rhodanobacter sp. Col0626 TaxID=3415679 RepID=UPI003CE8AAE5
MPPQTTRPTHRRTLLATLLLLLGSGLLSGCQAILFRSLNGTSGKSDVVVQHDVPFDPVRQLSLDVYRPRDARNAPVVVFFYGGSWKSGKRQWYRWAGEALARRGLVVVIPDYRQWPKVRLDGFMQDAAHAVAWTHAHAGEYGGDPSTLFVMGHSAGAHIGALLATDGHWLASVGMQPRQLAGFIGLAGPYDFLPLKNPDFIDMFGSTHAAQLRSQPVHYVDGDEPPMLLMQGTTDKVVWPRNATSLAAALQREGEPVELKLYPDIGHSAILLALSRPFRGKAPVLDDSVRFIRQHAGHITRAREDIH